MALRIARPHSKKRSGSWLEGELQVPNCPLRRKNGPWMEEEFQALSKRGLRMTKVAEEHRWMKIEVGFLRPPTRGQVAEACCQSWRGWQGRIHEEGVV